MGGFLAGDFRADAMPGCSVEAGAAPLGSPTFLPLDGFGAVEHSLEGGPTTPEDEPARTMISFAVLVTTEAGQGIEELPNRQVVPHMSMFVG